LTCRFSKLTADLAQAEPDIMSVSRAQQIVIIDQPPEDQQTIETNGNLIIDLS
jgi:hypothetical protein